MDQVTDWGSDRELSRRVAEGLAKTVDPLVERVARALAELDDGKDWDGPLHGGYRNTLRAKARLLLAAVCETHRIVQLEPHVAIDPRVGVTVPRVPMFRVLDEWEPGT